MSFGQGLSNTSWGNPNPFGGQGAPNNPNTFGAAQGGSNKPNPFAFAGQNPFKAAANASTNSFTNTKGGFSALATGNNSVHSNSTESTANQSNAKPIQNANVNLVSKSNYAVINPPPDSFFVSNPDIEALKKIQTTANSNAFISKPGTPAYQAVQQSVPASNPFALKPATPTNQAVQQSVLASNPFTLKPATPTNQPAQQPETKPSQQPETKLAQQPETKPAQQPETKLAQQPETKPAQQPETKPAQQPETKPTQQPANQTKTDEKSELEKKKGEIENKGEAEKKGKTGNPFSDKEIESNSKMSFTTTSSNVSKSTCQQNLFGSNSNSEFYKKGRAATNKKPVNTYDLPKDFVIKFYEMMHRIKPGISWEEIDKELKELAHTLIE